MNEEQTEQLKQLSHEQLCELIVSIHGADRQVDQRIEYALLAGDPLALTKHMKKRIQSINRGRRFIDYRESSAFSRELDQVVAEIAMLLPKDPKATFTLTDAFMNTHPKVLNRCDDSNGSIGDVYRYAAQLWMDAAVAWQASEQACKLNWSDEITNRHNDNGYGMWDNLIASSYPLLGEDALRDLAEGFKSVVIERKKKSTDRYDNIQATAQIGLKSVATALSDVPMYEQSYTINFPPNELQKESIVKFCLSVNDGASALKWLKGDWQERHFRTQQKLLDQAYQLTGKSGDLLALRREQYEKSPGYNNLQALIEIAPEKEQVKLKAQASRLASKSTDANTAIDTLLQLQDMEAVSNYVLKHSEKLEQVAYYALSDWAKVFEAHGLALPAVLAYRVLLLDILQSARTKAYRYAATYYRALERLDADVDSYQKWPDKTQFQAVLVEKHGKKRSFWGLVQ